MNGTSVITTTATSMGTAGAAQVLIWAYAGAHQPMPEGVALTLAAALMPIAHAFYRWISARFPAEPSPSAINDAMRSAITPALRAAAEKSTYQPAA